MARAEPHPAARALAAEAPQAVSRAAPSAVRAAPLADLGLAFDLLYGLERPPRA